MLSDNIWFTRIARIEASKRLLSKEKNCQVLLVSYSLLAVCLSIIFLVKSATEFDNVILCLFSTVILVLSLFISSNDYKGRGLQLKENYIELHNLYFLALDAEKDDDTDKIEEIRGKYTKTLHQTENHLTIDDIKSRSYTVTTRPLKESERQILNTESNLLLLKGLISWMPFVMGVIYGTKALFTI